MSYISQARSYQILVTLTVFKGIQSAFCTALLEIIVMTLISLFTAASYTATLTSFLVGTDPVIQVVSDYAFLQVRLRVLDFKFDMGNFLLPLASIYD